MEKHMTEQTPEEVAIEQSAQGTFSLIERLQNRNMPEEIVTIYLDEAAAYERTILQELHAKTTDGEKLADIDDQLTAVEAKIRASAIEVTLRAISSKRYDELLERVLETHPQEYEETTSPFTGERKRIEIPSPEREELLNTIYLAECIVQARMGDDVDETITDAWVKNFKDFAPLDALRLIITAAYRLRMTAEWMDGIQNSDF